MSRPARSVPYKDYLHFGELGDGHAVFVSEASSGGDVLGADTIRLDPAFLPTAYVIHTVVFREAPLGRLHHLLATRELELGSAKCFDYMVGVGVLGADRDDGRSDADARRHFHGLAIGATHTRRQTIRTSTGKHLILANHVEWMGANAHMVTVFSAAFGEILIASDTSSLKSRGCQLLLLVGHKMGDEGEDINRESLGTAIENSDLRVRYTTAMSALDVRFVLLET